MIRVQFRNKGNVIQAKFEVQVMALYKLVAPKASGYRLWADKAVTFDVEDWQASDLRVLSEALTFDMVFEAQG